MKESEYLSLHTQNTMPDKKELAVDMKAYIIFPWQIERVLALKFAGEASRAEEKGFVSH